MEDRSTLNTVALTEFEAARYIGMSVHFLRIRRVRKSAPAYIRLGTSIRYRVADLDAFLDERIVRPSAAPTEAAHA